MSLADKVDDLASRIGAEVKTKVSIADLPEITITNDGAGATDLVFDGSFTPAFDEAAVEAYVLELVESHTPGIELGYAELLSPWSTTANAAIPGLSVTVVGNGRPVDVEFFCSRVSHSVVGTYDQVRLLSNGVQIQQAADINPHATAGPTFNIRQRTVLNSGVSYTFTIYGFMGAAGTLTFDAASDRPMWLSVVSR